MNADEFRNKLNESANRWKFEYISDMRDWAEFAKSAEPEEKADFQIHALRYAGYFLMTGTEFPDSEIPNLRKAFETPAENVAAGLSEQFPFDRLELELAIYLKTHEKLGFPPNWWESPEEENEWEASCHEAEDAALELTMKGLDINALLLGRSCAAGLFDGNVPGWEKAWPEFEQKAAGFFNQLYDSRRMFYRFSTPVFLQTVRFPTMPDKLFSKFVDDVTATRKEHPREIGYRLVISADETDEIYGKSCIKFGGKPSVGQLYFYERALAEQVLLTFIQEFRAATFKQFSSGQNFPPAMLDESREFSDTPLLKSENSQFSIHLVSYPQTGGWGIRKDRLAPLLSPEAGDSGIAGSLFCSMKTYPNRAVLIRFDNYLDAGRMREILSQKAEPIKNYVLLEYAEVCKHDLRDEFLEKAAEAVLSSESISEPATSFAELDAFISVLMIEHMMAETVIRGIQKSLALFAIAARHLKHRKKEMSKGPPLESILAVPMEFENQWGGEVEMFSPFAEHENIKALIMHYYKTGVKWLYKALFVDRNGEDLGKSEGAVDRKVTIRLSIPEKTHAVLLAMGPETDMKEMVKIMETRTPEPEHSKTESGIFWIVYGPQKT